MSRYRRDHRAMRPIYECPENNISAKSADDCARRTLWHDCTVKIGRQIVGVSEILSVSPIF